MRQAGVLAAAGLIALEQHPARLAEDHRNARFMSETLARLPGFKVEAVSAPTNIVIVNVTGAGITANEFSARLKGKDVLMNAVSDREMRIVTHYDVSHDDCEMALWTMAQVASEAERAARTAAR
jgi:threonine aldolase